MENDNKTKEELHFFGIKNTKNKAILLEFLKNSTMPLTASELHLKCSQESKMDVATVYRTLQQFKEKSILKEILGGDSVVRYEYVGQDSKPHPHFQCEQCRELICLDALGFEDALYFSNMAKQHKIHSINITLSGICEGCQSQTRS